MESLSGVFKNLMPLCGIGLWNSQETIIVFSVSKIGIMTYWFKDFAIYYCWPA